MVENLLLLAVAIIVVTQLLLPAIFRKPLFTTFRTPKHLHDTIQVEKDLAERYLKDLTEKEKL